MQIILFEDPKIRLQLLPITFTRPMGAIRMGLMTTAERWQKFINADIFWKSEDYLAEIFPAPPSELESDCLWIAGNVIADAELAAAVLALAPGEALRQGDRVIAHRGAEYTKDREWNGTLIAIDRVYDIFRLNDKVLRDDFKLVTAGRTSAPLSKSNTLIGSPDDIFLEEGAKAEGAVFNTTTGPIYIGPHAEVMEGSCLRGPIALCEHATVNMGTRIYGATTLGPYCKVGGELNNVVMLGYANKAHDGFLGNAVIGEWCNLGGGTVASNLKNDYSEIKLWDYATHRFLRTGLQFCGLIMGDHSKSAINTSFNTATVIGVGCNIVSEGMPRVFIPSFSKGGTAGMENVNLNEFFTIASRVMSRRGVTLTDAYKHMCTEIFNFADKFK
ncbi:MAG: glucose-1-phosphate thymidylyltransferase [Muribaculaceae bacterium]|nr:glucose-1-phosphate thymidylyltransferase [Muribaculaceae bacterium]